MFDPTAHRNWTLIRAGIMLVTAAIFLLAAIAEASSRADLSLVALGLCGMAVQGLIRILERTNGSGPPGVPPPPSSPPSGPSPF